MSRSQSDKTREQRAVDQFACPTCAARTGAPCKGTDGRELLSHHGPGCHPLRRKLLSVKIEEKA
jgi:hypothetical protein